MYKWLEEELLRVRTPGFHVVDGPAPDDFRRDVLNARLQIPPSYREFIFRFGNAKLYREGSAYAVGVRAFPDPATSATKEPLRRVGHYEDVSAYFKEALLSEGEESPVFEWGPGGLTRVADGFSDWLERRCEAVRKRYGKKRWAEIEHGPAPFSADERAIVEARRSFRWRLLGPTDGGALRFEVENRSPRVLPYLSIGVRARDGKMSGGVWLPVSHVLPGAKVVIEKECYRNLVKPNEIEVFELPDPGPQDRDRYWEFKKG